MLGRGKRKAIEIIPTCPQWQQQSRDLRLLRFEELLANYGKQTRSSFATKKDWQESFLVIYALSVPKGNFSKSSPQYKYLVQQMRDHQVTQRVYSKAPQEAEHHTKAERARDALQRRERSVEESANLNPMAEDFEDAGQRYAFLLRPVKDLGKNFEINIAKELDDYCQQLRTAAENEEHDVDNQHRFNFAEAAMLIQGTAFVFGRKVDYVHSQAIHFFEALQPQKSKKKKKAGGGDDDEGFVDDNGDPLDPCDLLDYSNIKMCSVNSLYKDYSKSKYQGKPPKITVMPMSLMPLSDDEKNGVLIYSTGYRKEIVGKMDDFKMNAGFLNNRGVLLLQLVHEKIVDDFASEAFVRLWHPHLFPDSEEPKNPLDPQADAPDSGRGTPTECNGLAAGDAGRASSAMEIARRATSGTVDELQSARPSTQLLEVPESGSRAEKMEVDDGGDACCYDDDFDTAASMHLPAPDDVPKRPSRMQQQQPQIRPWESNDADIENDPTENMLMDPFVDLKWKTKPVEKIKRFVKGTTVATRLQKMEKATMTFQKQTMQTNDYVREHFYMRKKHKTTKGDDWVFAYFDPITS
ncbi:hypothetical protein ANCDUO_02030 [Ancylostoma duodenale]|uniref:Condensin II complex subunit H2 N-terminal domain-containing protein n=1 Tax=Ancylostoma duodenale TaxID=51022 RepID=A0A0C2DCP6_9BILA|nr:hypothetical protein ANCDUO_02030 [Ancylostoma duodenale]